MIEHPWMGMYKINADEPVTVNEQFMSDDEVAASHVQQFHKPGSSSEPDSFSEPSIEMEHERLSEFETDDDDEAPDVIRGKLL